MEQTRAARRRDADHEFVPSGARVMPQTCQVCGYDGYRTYANLGGGPRWRHGCRPHIVISHPDANILFDGGHRRHYPSLRFEGGTLCGRDWRGRGRILRLSDGIRGSVCLDCLVEINKTRERPYPRPDRSWLP